MKKEKHTAYTKTISLPPKARSHWVPNIIYE